MKVKRNGSENYGKDSQKGRFNSTSKDIFKNKPKNQPFENIKNGVKNSTLGICP